MQGSETEPQVSEHHVPVMTDTLLEGKVELFKDAFTRVSYLTRMLTRNFASKDSVMRMQGQDTDEAHICQQHISGTEES